MQGDAQEATIRFNKMINQYRVERGAYFDRNTGVWHGMVDELGAKNMDGDIKTYRP